MINHWCIIDFIDVDVISGPDAETLMDTTQTRNLLIDELLEVHTVCYQLLPYLFPLNLRS